MTCKKTNTTALIFLAAIVILLTRLPFVQNGYGSDSDAWRVANTARFVAATGEYAASRLPGYPLQELFYSLMWRWGGRAAAFNVTTALLSVLCFVFISLYLVRLRSRDWLLASMTIALTPVIFIHSTDAMDYVWALTFAWGCFYFVLKDWLWISGVCLGLAIGCRMTSGAMLIPAVLMLAHQAGRLDARRLLKLVLPAVAIGAAAYAPVVQRYGLSFARFVDAYPSILKIVYEATYGAWGVPGSLAIGVAGIALLVRRGPGETVSVPADRPLVIAWLAGLLLYMIAFLRLPHDAGYLIPAVPFAILLLGRFLDRRIFAGVCLAIILSSFVLSVEKTDVYLSGPVLRDAQMRRDVDAMVLNLLADQPGEKRVIVTGWYQPMIEAYRGAEAGGSTEYVSLLNAARLQDYRDRGFGIYYLPEVREYNLQVNRVDLAKEGGKPLRVPAGSQ